MSLRIESGASLGEVAGPPLGFEAIELIPCTEWPEVPQKLGLRPSECAIIAVDLSEVSRLAKAEFDPSTSFFEIVPHDHVYNHVFGHKSYIVDPFGAPTLIVLLHRPDRCKGAGRPHCDTFWQILPGRFFIVKESVGVRVSGGVKKRVFVVPEGSGNPTHLGWLELRICRHGGDECFGLGRVDVFFGGDVRLEPGAVQEIKIVSKVARAEGEKAARRVARAYLDRLGLDTAGKTFEEVRKTLDRLSQVHSKAMFCIQEDDRKCKCVEAPSISPRALGSIFLPHPRAYNIIYDVEGLVSGMEPKCELKEYRLGEEDIRLPDWLYGTYQVKYEVFRPPRLLKAASEAAGRPEAVQVLAQVEATQKARKAVGTAKLEVVHSLGLREDLVRVRIIPEENARGIRLGVRSLSPGFEGFYRFYASLKRGEEVSIYLRLVERGIVAGPGVRDFLSALSDTF